LRSGRTVRIFILTLVVVLPFAQLFVSSTKAVGVKQGPVFQTSLGRSLIIVYDPSISDQLIQVSNAFLNQYVPQLFRIFWEPQADATVEVTLGGCGGYSCGGSDGVSIRQSDWAYATIWVHEFTHVLQFANNGPGFALSGDPFLFYAETTATATSDMLAPLEPEVDCCDDINLSAKDQGLSLAVHDYALRSTGETHIPTMVWRLLYAADPNALKQVNSRLYHLAQQGQFISDMPSFRELIRQSISPQTIDGLPTRQWLAAEGFLGKDELANTPLTYIDQPFYYSYGPSNQFTDVAVTLATANGFLQIDTAQSRAWVSDAVTKTKLADLQIHSAQNGGAVFQAYLSRSSPPSVIRTDFHIVAGGFMEDRSILTPLLRDQGGGNPYLGGRGLVLISTNDGWLQSVSGSVNVGGQNSSLINGVGIFGLTGPATVTVNAGTTTQVQNFLPGQAVSIGVAYTAVNVMHDTGTINVQGGGRPLVTSTYVSSTTSSTSVTIVEDSQSTIIYSTSSSTSQTSAQTFSSTTVSITSNSLTNTVSTGTNNSTTQTLLTVTTESVTSNSSSSTIGTSSQISSITQVAVATSSTSQPEVKDMTIGVVPEAVTMPQSSSTTLTVTVNAAGSFNEPVNLEAQNLPAGVQVSFSPDPVIPTQNGMATSTATIVVQRSVPTGAYSFKIMAESGTIIREVPVQLQVSGCLIATATFGSELAPEVQFLRDFRDYKILQTFAGSRFMVAFNAWYYSFSPTVAQSEYSYPGLREGMQLVLYPLIEILRIGAGVFEAVPFNQEAAAIASGMSISALIGAVYLAPALALVEARSSRWKMRFCKLERYSTGMLLLSLAVVCLADVFRAGSLLMIGAPILIIATLVTAAFFVSGFFAALFSGPGKASG